MNVLFLSEQIYPHSSGAELATYLFAKMLSENGFNVRLVTNKFPKESFFSKDGKVSIYRLPLYEKFGTVKYTVMAKFNVLLSDFMSTQIQWADVVYVPRFWFSVIPLVKAHGKPVITHLHDYIAICPLTWAFNFSKDINCKGNKLICSPKCSCFYEKIMDRPLKGMFASVALNSMCGKLFSKLIGLSDAIVCVSDAQKKVITNSGFTSSNKLSVVHNPFINHPPLPLHGHDFGFFGGLDRAKGFQTLYSAISKKPSLASHFAIHCTKFPQTIRSTDALRSLGFLTYGKLETKRYEQIYSQLFAVVVPSVWFEPWPYTVIEALLNRRYVIASRIGGIPDQVNNCKGVTLVEHGNAQQLKVAMNDAFNIDREALLELGNQNRDAFLSRFSNAQSLKEFIQVIDNVSS